MASGFSQNRLDVLMPTLAARYIATGAIPGGLLLIWRGGRVAHLDMAGSMDLERGMPMQEDALFRIYSMTKPITSLALLMLLEEGKVALDDPVSRYIPAFAGLGVWRGGEAGQWITEPPARPMQVLDLLRHTSGLSYGFHDRHPVEALYSRNRIGEPQTQGGLATMMAQLAELPLLFPPGEQWNYSVATDVVGYLVEVISGRRFGDFLQQRIFAPLGMQDTAFHVRDDQRARFSNCYQVKDGKLVVQDDGQRSAYMAPPALESGGGGLVSTAHDYMRFCRLMLGKGRLDATQLLSPKTVALMTMNQLPGGKQMTDMMPATNLFNETGYAGVGFGLGFGVTVDVAATRIPGTVGEFAWGGAASTVFFVDPKEDMAVVFMTQVLGAPDRMRLRRELRTLVYSAMTESFVD